MSIAFQPSAYQNNAFQTDKWYDIVVLSGASWGTITPTPPAIWNDIVVLSGASWGNITPTPTAVWNAINTSNSIVWTPIDTSN